MFICLLFSIFILSNKVYAYKEYKIGDKVTYNEIDFYVIKDSSSDSDYVTLLKAEPLTVDEVNRYGKDENGNNVVNVGTYTDAIYIDGYGGMSYNDVNCNPACSNEYKNSAVKYVVDGWAVEKLNLEDLKLDPSGALCRLLSFDDVINLNYKKNSSKKYTTDKNLEWFYNDKYQYWTMFSYMPDTTVYTVKKNGNIEITNVASNGYVVRPVINLIKRNSEDIIDNKEELVDDEDKKIENEVKDSINVNNNLVEENNNEIIKVPNTLKSISGLVILIGMVLVCVGLNIFIIIKNKDRKKD